MVGPQAFLIIYVFLLFSSRTRFFSLKKGKKMYTLYRSIGQVAVNILAGLIASTYQ